MSKTAKETLRVVERELLKFGSYEHAKKLLNKYMIGSDYNQEMVEKILVILVAEFRHEIEKISGNLPDDAVEAAAVVERKATGARGRRSMKI
jgi:cell division GTPase FtsZ